MSEQKTISAYKGVDKNLRGYGGFKYEVGKEYYCDGEIEVCKNGFHACERPIDTFRFYAPASSRYLEVELSGDMDADNEGIKTAARHIKITRELTIVELLMEQIKYDHTCKGADGNSGDSSSAFNSVDASNAVNSCYASSAFNSGFRSNAVNSGDASSAFNSGNASNAVNSGFRSNAVNSGFRSSAFNSGDASSAVNSGDESSAFNSGNDSIAIASGYCSKAKACIGSAICVCERGKWNGKTYPLLAIKAAIIDGEILKADTWYTLMNGKFVEVQE